MAGGLELDGLYDLLQPKPLYDNQTVVKVYLL